MRYLSLEEKVALRLIEPDHGAIKTKEVEFTMTANEAVQMEFLCEKADEWAKNIGMGFN
jgi:hypothetical protein